MKKIQEILKREQEFEFPQFLCLLRESAGGKRKIIAQETNISEYLLFHWEHGKFKKAIKTGNLVALADYYNIPFKLIFRKMKEYIQEKNENCD